MSFWLGLPMILGMAALAAVAIGSVLLVLYLTTKRGGGQGGWLRLVEQFGTSASPSGTVLAKQTVQIGGVLYRNCTTLGIAPEGLYITTWRRTVLIPWSEFRGISQGRLFWERVPVLSVGDPVLATLAVPLSVFERLRARLPETLLRTA